MKVALYKQYENTPAIGVYPLCNWGGLEILAIEYGIDDYVVACFNFGTDRQKIRRHKICYSTSGRDYIRKEGTRYYLDNVMRV